MNPTVDFYFSKSQKWQPELDKLRLLLLDCGLTEVLKWGVPCYQFQKRNIVLLHEFKGYCALMFFKGVLLQDANGILIQQTENTQATRQIRFTSIREISALEPTLKAYVFEAIEIEKAGLEVTLKKTSAYTIPEEFQHELGEIPGLKAAFEALTPGRQRAYLLYFSEPKQAKTRVARIEKYRQKILDGKGLMD